MDIDFVTIINDAIAARNWPLLVVAILCLVVPIVLTALGKNVPIVSDILKALLGFFKTKKVEVPPEAPVEPSKGLSAVVKVEEEKKP